MTDQGIGSQDSEQGDGLDRFRWWLRQNPAAPGLPTLLTYAAWKQSAQQARSTARDEPGRVWSLPAVFSDPGVMVERAPWGMIVRRFFTVDQQDEYVSAFADDPDSYNALMAAGLQVHTDDHVIVFEPPKVGIDLPARARWWSSATRRRPANPDAEFRGAMTITRTYTGAGVGLLAAVTAGTVGMPIDLVSPAVTGGLAIGAGAVVGAASPVVPGLLGRKRSRLIRIDNMPENQAQHNDAQIYRVTNLICMLQFYWEHRDQLSDAEQVIKLCWQTIYEWAGLAPELTAEGEHLDTVRDALIRQLVAASALIDDVERRDEILRRDEDDNHRRMVADRLQRALEHQPGADTIDQLTNQIELEAQAHQDITDSLEDDDRGGDDDHGRR